ncbi:hypothetical protein SAMN04487895_101607 [Paenibacillus sophorae]|uniref:Uncharacterized protein n=1 Tax=Paenibacillus sophorae TaxID=1333845 RepID=A0A1H8GRV0_9BACL|nr:hypothetical protein [Paenibacillus sophorae]QWU14305.1 hypothetical protein KP014_20575 [Paenibacillus sophorae]SEN46217.1 hypothetical protein SAMN04487895_101607 [Paenibacillus sophorae]
MFDKTLEEVLSIADKCGIECELNSDKPGFYAVEEDGSERMVLLHELLFLPKEEDQVKNTKIKQY